MTPAAEPLRVAPRRYGRARIAAFRLVQRALGALGARRLYRRRHLAPGRFRVRREAVALPPAARDLAGYRVAQLSDPHAGPFLGAGDLRAVVDATNALAPDLVVLTGDLITERPDEAYLLLDDLARLAAPDGALGVFGNHDYRDRREREIAARFARDCGVRFLLNETETIERGGARLAVVGVEDLEESRDLDLGAALEAARGAAFRLALCHNPAGAPALAAAGCELVLSGHTHGHQVDLPLVRRLAPRHPGDRVALGGGAVGITSRGLGALGLPLRVRSPAEVVLVELVEPHGEAAGAR